MVSKMNLLFSEQLEQIIVIVVQQVLCFALLWYFKELCLIILCYFIHIYAVES
jgi:hypothetical protein